MKRFNCHCNSATIIPRDCISSGCQIFRNILLSESGSDCECLDEIDSLDSGCNFCITKFQLFHLFGSRKDSFASGQKLHLIIKSFIQYQLIAFHVVLVYPCALKYEHMKWLKISFVTCMYQHMFCTIETVFRITLLH